MPTAFCFPYNYSGREVAGQISKGFYRREQKKQRLLFRLRYLRLLLLKIRIH